MIDVDAINFVSQMLPVIVIIAVLAGVAHSLLSFGSGGGGSISTGTMEDEDDINTYDAEKRMRIEIEKELRERYVRGEISSEEFTEKMARM